MTTDGGGWTVFQRNKAVGSLNFYRKWAEYEQGFGDLNGEFWLGLEKIHRLTHHSKKHSLRVDVINSANAVQFAKYSSFRIKDGTIANQYMLEIGGYTGNAGDRLAYHNGRKFSTYDRDNDVVRANCAVKYRGAWWYRSCYYSNLNGVGSHFYWSGPVKKSEMKMRQN